MLLTVIVTIIVTIIFSIDEKIFTGKTQERLPVYIFKDKEKSTVVFKIKDSKNNDQILPSSGSGKIEK